MGVAALVVMAVAAVASTTASVVAGNQSRAAQRHANDLNEQAYNEQRAGNAQQQAEAARQQYRQDRVQRARIMQSSENTGASYSSGELGSLGSLQTQYSNNQGQLDSTYDRNQTIGALTSAANQSIFDGQQRASSTNNIGSIFQGIGSLAGASYRGSNSLAKIPGTTAQSTTG